MPKNTTPNDPATLTAAQRTALVGTARRLTIVLDRAKAAHDRAIAPHVKRYKQTVADAESEYDAAIRAILAEPDSGQSEASA